MRIRIVYSDLSEWTGDIKDYNNSPQTGICEKCKGILTFTVFYDKTNKLTMNGHDYYAVKDSETKVEFAFWSEYFEEGHCIEVDKKTLEQKIWHFKKENPPTDMVIKLGKWTSDENMELANKTTSQWL